METVSCWLKVSGSGVPMQVELWCESTMLNLRICPECLLSMRHLVDMLARIVLVFSIQWDSLQTDRWFSQPDRFSRKERTSRWMTPAFSKRDSGLWILRFRQLLNFQTTTE